MEMTKEQRSLWKKTVLLLVTHIDSNTFVLKLLGLTPKLATRFVQLRNSIPQSMEKDFKEWLLFLLYEDNWVVEEDKISIVTGSTKYHDFTFDGIVRCFISGMNHCISFGCGVPSGINISHWSGYPGFSEACDIADCLIRGEEPEEYLWDYFKEATGSVSIEAVCKTLLAGSLSWEADCKKLLELKHFDSNMD